MARSEWDYGYEEHPDPAIQEKCFREQLVLAEELDLPVVIHNREADEDTLRILKDYHIRGAIHRIFSPIAYAREFIKMGIYMGFGPQITYPGSGLSCAACQRVPEGTDPPGNGCTIFTKLWNGDAGDTGYDRQSGRNHFRDQRRHDSSGGCGYRKGKCSQTLSHCLLISG